MRTRSSEIIRKLRKSTSHDDMHRPASYEELGKKKTISKIKKKRDRLNHFLESLYAKKAENYLKKLKKQSKQSKVK